MDKLLNGSIDGYLASGKRLSVKEVRLQEADVEVQEHNPGPTPTFRGPSALGAHTDADMLRGLLALYARPHTAPKARAPSTPGASATSALAAAVEAGGAECGAGCSISFLVKPLLAALATRRRFVAAESHFATGAACPDDDERAL
eukprot:2519986-Prymnesium_polylepis.1